MEALKGLNEKQKEAVLATEGPVLVLAGPGSGKTKALTHRIAYLLKEKGISPFNILAITFTNKAAETMGERVGLKLPWLGTFHAVCAKILRQEIRVLDYKSSFTIYDEDDSLRTVKRAMENLKISPNSYNPYAIRAFISGAKNELLTPKEYEKFVEGHFQEVVNQVYPEYQKMLKDSNALDFDDLLMITAKIFEKHPEVLKKYQRLFKYILIDEYQDTNQAQYVFAKLLANRHQNIFVIGDDWQAIYGFRGANFRNILNFEKDYPRAKIIRLEENYRSTPIILEAAQRVIEKNLERTEKKLFTRKKGGDLVTLAEVLNQAGEGEFVHLEIESLRRQGKRLSDIVILYRTHAQSRAIEEYFLNVGLPYRIVGGVRFYERKEIKDILAYLRLILNLADSPSLSRIINFPPRGIGEKTLGLVLKSGLNVVAKTNPRVNEFRKLVERLRASAEGESPAQLIEEVAEVSGIKRYYSQEGEEGEIRLENIEELKSVALNHDSLPSFLEAVALMTDQDSYDEKAESVTLMTLHTVKGLEFPVVFIVGVEEGLLPHERSLFSPQDLEEERRLFYVGITRAKEKLFLTSAKSRLIYGNIKTCLPSSFLKEIPEELIDFVEV